MKKSKFSRAAVSVVMSVAMIAAMFMPCIGLSVFADGSFPAPVITSDPQLLKETPTPNVTISTDSFADAFAPSFSGTVSSGAPVISNITAQARPDSTVVINGKGFTGGSVWVYGIDSQGSGIYRSAEILNITDTDITAVISRDFAYGMYYVWVRSASGLSSYPVRVNSTDVSWISDDEAAPGSELKIYGKNLTYKSGTGVSDAWIYLTSASSSYKATVTEANPYRVTVTLPKNLPNGEYTVWAHNGHGGDYGWSAGTPITINKNADSIWTGNVVTVAATTQEALVAAIQSANEYDTIYLPKGTYEITSQINLTVGSPAPVNQQKALRFVGEGDGSEVVLLNSIVNTKPLTVTNMFLITKLPSEFKNITFEENVNVYKNNFTAVSTGMLYVNPYLNKQKGYENGSFKLNNCRFIQHRLMVFSTPSTRTDEYDALLNDYNDPSGSHYTEGDWLDDMIARRAAIIENTSTTGYLTPSSTPVAISAASHVDIKNCYFEGNYALSTRGCEYVNISDNFMLAKAVMYGNSGSSFIHNTHTDKLDISNNTIHGKDLYDDPDGDVEVGDQSLCRSIIVQLPSGSSTGSYFADNELRRVADNASNSGEQIMYECLQKDFMDKPASVSADGKTITFDKTKFISKSETYQPSGNTYTSWYAESYTAGTDGDEQDSNIYISDDYAMIVDGTGESQYRKIAGFTENSITVDRPWDIAPDSTSTIALARVVHDTVVYRNDFIGSKSYNKIYNASAGVQAYATMLDYIADSNDFSWMKNGFFCDSHYSNSLLASTHDTLGANYSNLPISGFNWFMDTMIINNKVSHVDRGIEVRLEFNSADDVLDGSKHISTCHGIVIRDNDVSDADYSYNYQKNSQGNYYNTNEGIGCNLITVGSFDAINVTWGANRKIWPGDWIKNTVVESNTLSRTERSYIRLRYHQSATVVRNNNCDKIADASRYIEYDTTRKATYPDVERAILYNNYGTSAEGMYGPYYYSTALNSLANGDFSQGLKYWAPASAAGSASEYASVETDSGSNYVKLSGKSGTSGITSAAFRLTGAKENSKLAIIFDYKGDMPTVELSGRGMFTASSSPTVLDDASAPSGFTRAITKPVIFSGISDPALAEAKVTVKTASDSLTSYVGDIKLVYVNQDEGYYETAEGAKYYLSDGSPYGGTQADGIVPKDSGDIFSYPASNGLLNGDFNDGFRYWTDISGTKSASTNASVSGGAVTITGDNSVGIMSAPFKINASALSANSAENAVAFITKYNNGSVKTYVTELYKNGQLISSSSTKNNGTAPLRYIYFSSEKWDANAVYNVVLRSNSTSSSTSIIDSVEPARYDSTLQTFTSLTDGRIYKRGSGELGGSESSGMSSSELTTVVTPTLANGDFSQGLKYWNAASATVSNGEVTLSSGTLISAYFEALGLAAEQQFAILYKYKTSSSSATVNLKDKSGSLNRTVTLAASTDYTYGATETLPYRNYTLAVSFAGSLAVSEVRLVTVANGVYTDVITGERFYVDPIGTVGGTEENGIYKEKGVSGLTAIPANDTFENGDFSQGFKHWTARFNNAGYASDYAVCENGVVSLNVAGAWNGISSVMFKLPNAALGRSVTVVFDYKGNTNGFLRLYKNSDNSNKNITCGNTNGEWKTYSFSGPAITDVNDLYYFDVSQSATGDTSYFRNIRIYYVDAGNGSYVNLDNSPIGFEYGDANCDGVVDIRDLVRVSSVIAGKTVKNTYYAAANVDKDSNVNLNASDLTVYKEYLLTGVKNF